ncbi:MAG: hypothetical protein Kow0031_25790 [Anaerolineae bacterium]
MNHNRYQLAMPPRSVPLAVRVQAIFGGASGQFGWLFFGFGMIFVWIFGLPTLIYSMPFWLGGVETAPGVVAAVQGTDSSENEVPVMANQYIFRVERLEREYRGESYTTGSQYSVGDEVTIEYVADNPDISRIAGTRTGHFSTWALCFVGIFPLVGLAFIAVSLAQGFRGIRLLKNGKIAGGRLVDKSPTGTRINNLPVYQLTFEFIADDGMPYRATARSHLPASLQDEALEQLVYDPRNPSKAVLLDNLPGSPDIDETGQIYGPASPIALVLPLLLPVVVVLVHGSIIMAMIF